MHQVKIYIEWASLYMGWWQCSALAKKESFGSQANVFKNSLKYLPSLLAKQLLVTQYTQANQRRVTWLLVWLRFWLIYHLADLPLVSNFKTILFADDTVLSLISEFTVQSNNKNKSRSRKKSFHTNFNVQINHHQLARTRSVSCLWVIIDGKLIWKPHITRLISKFMKH